MGSGLKTYFPPDWITVEFIQDVLREYFKDNLLEVSDMNIQGVSNGIASDMHRVTFNLKRIQHDDQRKFSVIVKDHPKGFTGVVAHKRKLFKREILTYKEILPRIEDLLKSLGDTTRIAPACYYTTETPEPFLILEDMNLSGYNNYDQQRLLSLEYILLVMKKIAKLHACSAVLAKDNPELMEFFHEPPISQNTDSDEFIEFYPVNIRCVAQETSNWKGYENITKKMLQLSENFLTNACEMYASHAKGFCVFNITDLWIHNVMFHINSIDHQPDDAVVLDFQLCYYGSPAMDINYFLFGSVSESVRKIHLKYIVREYHHCLQDTLNKLQYKSYIPSLKDITIDMIKNSLQGVIAATCLTPIIFMNNIDNENLKILTSSPEDGNKLRRTNIENPKYHTFLQRTLKDLDLSGYLDI